MVQCGAWRINNNYDIDWTMAMFDM
jgi:hypothetical protein